MPTPTASDPQIVLQEADGSDLAYFYYDEGNSEALFEDAQTGSSFAFDTDAQGNALDKHLSDIGANAYTDEDARDAIADLVTGGQSVDVDYDDAGPGSVGSLTINARPRLKTVQVNGADAETWESATVDTNNNVIHNGDWGQWTYGLEGGGDPDDVRTTTGYQGGTAIGISSGQYIVSPDLNAGGQLDVWAASSSRLFLRAWIKTFNDQNEGTEVELSTDGGSTWTTVAVTEQATSSNNVTIGWNRISVEMTSLIEAGNDVRVRFNDQAGGGGDDFFVDDIRLVSDVETSMWHDTTGNQPDIDGIGYSGGDVQIDDGSLFLDGGDLIFDHRFTIGQDGQNRTLLFDQDIHIRMEGADSYISFNDKGGGRQPLWQLKQNPTINGSPKRGGFAVKRDTDDAGMLYYHGGGAKLLGDPVDANLTVPGDVDVGQDLSVGQNFGIDTIEDSQGNPRLEFTRNPDKITLGTLLESQHDLTLVVGNAEGGLILDDRGGGQQKTWIYDGNPIFDGSAKTGDAGLKRKGRDEGLWLRKGGDVYIPEGGLQAQKGMIRTESGNPIGAGRTFVNSTYFALGTEGAIQIQSSGDPRGGLGNQEATIWVDDGSGPGDKGDLMLAVRTGGTTKTTTLADHSAL